VPARLFASGVTYCVTAARLLSSGQIESSCGGISSTFLPTDYL